MDPGVKALEVVPLVVLQVMVLMVVGMLFLVRSKNKSAKKLLSVLSSTMLGLGVGGIGVVFAALIVWLWEGILRPWIFGGGL